MTNGQRAAQERFERSVDRNIGIGIGGGLLGVPSLVMGSLGAHELMLPYLGGAILVLGAITLRRRLSRGGRTASRSGPVG